MRSLHKILHFAHLPKAKYIVVICTSHFCSCKFRICTCICITRMPDLYLLGFLFTSYNKSLLISYITFYISKSKLNNHDGQSLIQLHLEESGTGAARHYDDISTHSILIIISGVHSRPPTFTREGCGTNICWPGRYARFTAQFLLL